MLHSWPHDNPLSSPTWLPLVIAGIGIVCPRCKKIYDLGVTIEPVYPEAREALKIVGLFAAGDEFLHVIQCRRDPNQLPKNGVSISRGASEIDWLLRILILDRILMNGISGWTWIFPPLRESPRDPALLRMPMEVPSSLEKPQ